MRNKTKTSTKNTLQALIVTLRHCKCPEVDEEEKESTVHSTRPYVCYRWLASWAGQTSWRASSSWYLCWHTTGEYPRANWWQRRRRGRSLCWASHSHRLSLPHVYLYRVLPTIRLASAFNLSVIMRDAPISARRSTSSFPSAIVRDGNTPLNK